jgi:putative DNA-invertase from lambdoid prophage Rac
LRRAKAEGKRLGRPASLTAEQRASVARRLGEGVAVSALARAFKTSRQTILRVREAMVAS